MKNTLKKIIAMLLTASTLLSLTAIPSLAASSLSYGQEWDYYENTKDYGSYNDVPYSHWGYDAITRVSQKSWMQGYENDTFRPDRSISRAEAATVLARFSGIEEKKVNKSSFNDVNDWYTGYVEAMKNIVPSRNSKMFQPDHPITREDVVVALVICMGYEGELENADQWALNMFEDKNSISKFAKPYFAVAVENNLVSGFEDDTIRAQDDLSRAEFATLLYRASYIGFGNKEEETFTEYVELDTSAKKIELEIGDTFTIEATAYLSDGSTEDYSDKVYAFNSDDNDVVSINRNKIKASKAGTCEINFSDDYLEDKYLIIIVNEPARKPGRPEFFPKKDSNKRYEEDINMKEKGSREKPIRVDSPDEEINGNMTGYGEIWHKISHDSGNTMSLTVSFIEEGSYTLELYTDDGKLIAENSIDTNGCLGLSNREDKYSEYYILKIMTNTDKDKVDYSFWYNIH